MSNPKWTQVESLRRFQDVGKQQRVRTDSGKVRKVPALPYEYWLKPSGSVVRLVVMTTRNVSEAVDPQRYADFTRRRALRNDWIPWEWAEVRAYAPQQASGCATEADWHARRAELQRVRMEAHNKQTAENSRWLSAAADARQLETKEAFTVALKEFTEATRKPKSNG